MSKGIDRFPFYRGWGLWHFVAAMNANHERAARGASAGPSRLEVWRMFDRIAPRYDLANRLMTFGLDRAWRRRLARHLPDGPNLVLLDLATGTADQVLLLCQVCDRIRRAVGMDLSGNMLAAGRRKLAARGQADRIELVTGDAMAIPAPDRSFDAVSMAFGIRNVTGVDVALREIRRVLRPGGRVLILETSVPGNPLLRLGHRFHLRFVLPALGHLVAGDGRAYRYLARTIETFPSGEAFCELLRQAGFVDVWAVPLAGGVSTLYRGDRPAGEGV